MKPIRLILLAFLGLSFVCWPGLPGHSATPHVVKRGQMHMGTLVFLTAVASDERLAHDAIEQGFAEIHRLEQILSTWIPDSELSRINAAAGQHAVKAGPETMELSGTLVGNGPVDGGRFQHCRRSGRGGLERQS